MTDKELLQQALDELLGWIQHEGWSELANANPLIVALRERLAQPEQEPVGIKWTENGDKHCGYNNWLGETPFGRILITWKGWKKYHEACVDEFPGDFFYAGSPSDVKDACEKEFRRRMESAAPPVPAGMQLAPVEPTEATEIAGMRAARRALPTATGKVSREQVFACWNAMLTVAKETQ